MADLNDVMAALQNADAAGNAEDARQLAQIAASMRTSGASPNPNPPTDTSPSASDATPNVLEGMRQRAEEIGGHALQGLAAGRSYVQSHIMGNPAEDGLTEPVKGAGQALLGDAKSINYQGTSWDDAKKGGLGGILKYGAENAIVGAPDVLASALPPTIVPYFIAQTDQFSRERAANDGRPNDVQPSDVAAGMGTALAQVGLSHLGAKALGGLGAKSVAGRVATAVGSDVATGAGQAAVTDVGTQAGTQKGLDLGQTAQDMEAGGVTGAVGAGMYRGAKDLPTATKGAMDEAKGSRILDEQGPEQAASNMRVADLHDRVKQAAESAGTGDMVSQDSNHFKSASLELQGQLKNAVDDLRKAGDITAREHADLVGDGNSVMNHAARHNRAFGDLQLGRIDSLDVDDSIKQALKDGFRDLNTSVYNGMFKNGSGTFENYANKIAYPLATAGAGVGGMYAGHPLVAYGAVPLAAAGIRSIGKGIDSVMGDRTPPVMQGIDKLRKATVKRGMVPGDALGALDAVSRDAQQRRSALADFAQAAQQEAQLQKVRDVAQKGQKVQAQTSQRAQALQDRARLMAAVPSDAPVTGGHINAVSDWFRQQGYDASPDHVTAAIDLLNQHGGFSSPEQYQLARKGYEFPGKTLTPLFQATGLVLRDAGIGKDRGVAAGEKGSALAAARLAKRVADAQAPPVPKSAPQAPQGAPQGPVQPAPAPQVPQPGNVPQSAPVAPPGPIPTAVRRRPSKPNQSPPPTPVPGKAGRVGKGTAGDYPAPENAEGIRNVLSYKSTVTTARAAAEQAKRSAPSEDLRSLVEEVERRKDKGAKAQVVEEAAKMHKDDPEASKWIMGPLRTLSKIGGRDATAEEKAVTSIRARKKAAS